MAQLDFSTQGDRSGGFVQPNLKPSAISRLTGPVTGNVSNFMNGTMNGNRRLPRRRSSDLPLPLLFGCIPLGEVIQAVTNLAGKPEKVPKFAIGGEHPGRELHQRAGSAVRLRDEARRSAGTASPTRRSPRSRATLQDLLDQAQAYAAPLVADVKARVNQLTTALDGVATQVQQLFDIDDRRRAGAAGTDGRHHRRRKTAATNLRTTANASVGGVSLPSGFRQSALQVANADRHLPRPTSRRSPR